MLRTEENEHHRMTVREPCCVAKQGIKSTPLCCWTKLTEAAVGHTHAHTKHLIVILIAYDKPCIQALMQQLKGGRHCLSFETESNTPDFLR